MAHISYLQNVVQQVWNTLSFGSKGFCLKNKLTEVRKGFTTWNNQVFVKVEQEIWHQQQLLQSIQNAIQCLDDIRSEKEIRKNLELLLEREQLMWAQKASSAWVIQGHRNTKFFQTVVKQRKARTCVIQLKNFEGMLTENPGEIEIILLNHFKHHFQSL